MSKACFSPIKYDDITDEYLPIFLLPSSPDFCSVQPKLIVSRASWQFAFAHLCACCTLQVWWWDLGSTVSEVECIWFGNHSIYLDPTHPRYPKITLTARGSSDPLIPVKVRVMLRLPPELLKPCSGSVCHTMQYMQHCNPLYSWLYQC